VTVETGARLNGSLLAAGVIDEIVLYMAPMILGDTAQGMFAIAELSSLDAATRMHITDLRQIGEDVRVTARLSS
jgi:diaminohydroxyphosphoribosylaminopyrimidine deaminase / 5-amino-6-(5-phosphoribosylamino)uracil reductase